MGSATLEVPHLKQLGASVELMAATMALSKHYFSLPFEVFCEDTLRSLIDEENVEEIFNFAKEIDSPRLRVFCLEFAYNKFALDPQEGPLNAIIRAGVKELLERPTSD